MDIKTWFAHYTYTRNTGATTSLVWPITIRMASYMYINDWIEMESKYVIYFYLKYEYIILY